MAETGIKTIVFIGDYEQYNSVHAAEWRAKELAELGHKVTVMNVAMDEDNNPQGLQYEGVINMTTAEARTLEV